MPLEYEFDERLGLSQGVSAGANVADILRSNMPSVVAVHAAHESNDRNGTDYWAETSNGKMLSVDCKIRTADWAPKGEDDIALETWSVVEKQVVGWTRDRKKQTDYVLWLWTDTGRWCLVPFPMLCRVFEQNWKIWKQQYKTKQQFTPNHGGYHSECTFVPRREVWAEIYRIFGGSLH
jgi:hypothetical protein